MDAFLAGDPGGRLGGCCHRGRTRRTTAGRATLRSPRPPTPRSRSRRAVRMSTASERTTPRASGWPCSPSRSAGMAVTAQPSVLSAAAGARHRGRPSPPRRRRAGAPPTPRCRRPGRRTGRGSGAAMSRPGVVGCSPRAGTGRRARRACVRDRTRSARSLAASATRTRRCPRSRAARPGSGPPPRLCLVLGPRLSTARQRGGARRRRSPHRPPGGGPRRARPSARARGRPCRSRCCKATARRSARFGASCPPSLGGVREV